MNIARTIDIDARPQTLWSVITDPEKVKGWLPEMISEEPTTPGPARVGMISRAKIKEGSRIVDYITEITAYEPESYFELELRAGSLGKSPMRIGYRIKPNGKGVSLCYTVIWRPMGLFMRLMYPLILVMGKRNARFGMERLKTFAEAQPAAVA